ncbi:hypothetical protein [Trinickia diaoshuihuensis]|uniref:hypothetical protein n=1 Tax=Trinickia diaoshuihuensis TaxID=2292265 RepID=UPI001F081D39|nr:hypothetical protein [Trinickia diaoshuihuensis]
MTPALRRRDYADERHRMKRTLEKDNIPERSDQSPRTGAVIGGMTSAREDNKGKVRPFRLPRHPSGDLREIRVAQRFFGHHGTADLIVQQFRKMFKVGAYDRVGPCLAQ